MQNGQLIRVKLSLDNAVNFYDFFEGVETVLVVSKPKEVKLVVDSGEGESSVVNLKSDNIVILCMSSELASEKGVFAVISDMPTTQLDGEEDGNNGHNAPEVGNSGS